jgi:uncharacterized membrane protein YqhA
MFGYNARPATGVVMASKFETAFEKLLFASRWILAPIFLGLSLALIALGLKFFQEAFHVITVMVMVSGYENFVSTIDAKGSDSLNWLGKLDAGTLKLKVAASIVAISSIHLLRKFMEVEKITDSPNGNYKIMWYIIMHMAFVLSAVFLGVLDKMSFSKHRDH